MHQVFAVSDAKHKMSELVLKKKKKEKRSVISQTTVHRLI